MNEENKIIYKFSDKIKPEQKHDKSVVLLKVFSCIAVILMIALMVYSIIANVRIKFDNSLISQYVILAVGIFTSALIFYLSATKKWGEFIQFTYNHNLNKKIRYRKDALLEAVDMENAIIIYEDCFVIKKNGVEKLYVIEKLKNVEFVRNTDGFTLKFDFKSGLRRVFNTTIPLCDLEKVKGIFNSDMIRDNEDKNSNLPEEITPKTSLVFVVVAFLSGVLGVALAILSALNYINLPFFFSMFVMIIGFFGVLLNFVITRNINRGIVAIIAGFMFAGISICALFACFFAVKANNILITITKMPISILLIVFFTVSIYYIFIGVFQLFGKENDN